MRNAASYTPLPGQSQTVNLIYNQGYLEIINDSGYTLQVNAIGGGAPIEAGAKVLIANVEGGNNMQILCLQPVLFNTDGTVSTASVFPPITANANVIINEYNKDEVAADSYPTSISRVVLPNVRQPVFHSIRILGATTYTNNALFFAGFYAARIPGLNPTGFFNFNAMQVYLLGFDFTGPPRATTSTYQIVLGSLYGPDNEPSTQTMQWTAFSTSGQGPQLFVRFPIPIPNATPAFGSNLTITGLDATLIYNITFYGLLQ